jgi:hypothetical protein
MPDSHSSVKFSINYSIDRLKTYLEEWKSTESGYVYKTEKIEEQNQILFVWENKIQGAKNLFHICWTKDHENKIKIEINGWIEVNPSLSKSTMMALNLKGFLKFFPRKRALMHFIDLTNFLKGNPKEIIHYKIESSQSYISLMLGFALRWMIFLLIISMLFVIFIAFNNNNLALIGLFLDFLLVTIIVYWFNKRNTN